MPEKRNPQAAVAKDILAHYFRLAAKGGWDYDSDSTAEIENIVDLIIRAAAEVARAEAQEEIERLESRISDLELKTARLGNDYD